MSSGNSDFSNVYDPAQSLQEKREIRKEYRSIISQFNPDKVIDTTPESLDHALDVIQRTFAKVKNPHEARMDSAALASASNLALAQARKLQTNFVGLDLGKFVTKLVVFMRANGAGSASESAENSNDDDEDGSGGDDGDDNGGGASQKRTASSLSQASQGRYRSRAAAEKSSVKIDSRFLSLERSLNWKALDDAVTFAFNSAPSIDFMHGPLTIKPAVRKVANRARTKGPSAEDKVKPMEATAEQLVTVEETAQETENIRNLLIKFGEEGINIFKLVINPHSFSQTVENIFYLSFLVRLGHAEIAPPASPSEPPIVYASAPYNPERDGTKETQKQFIFSLNMIQWKELIDIYHIKEPLIPNRAKTAHSANPLKPKKEQSAAQSGKKRSEKRKAEPDDDSE